jgi:hypothetical protein
MVVLEEEVRVILLGEVQLKATLVVELVMEIMVGQDILIRVEGVEVVLVQLEEQEHLQQAEQAELEETIQLMEVMFIMQVAEVVDTLGLAVQAEVEQAERRVKLVIMQLIILVEVEVEGQLEYCLEDKAAQAS